LVCGRFGWNQLEPFSNFNKSFRVLPWIPWPLMIFVPRQR
jgi:hypothetical protein